MVSIRFNKFYGSNYKLESRLLPNEVGQESYNIDISTGAMVPLMGVEGTRHTLVDAATSLHIVHDGNTPKFLQWSSDVDVIERQGFDFDDQTFYYTGDGVPKVSNFAMAIPDDGVTGGPREALPLGLPLPTQVLSATTAGYEKRDIISLVRDSANLVKVICDVAHSLRTGAYVGVFYKGSFDSIESFQTTGARITVTGVKTFQYFSVGGAASHTFDGIVTDGSRSPDDPTFQLAGNPQLRTYLYTWITDTGEESIPSDVSNELYVREGEVVTVAEFPLVPPSGSRVRGIRLYRSLVSATGTQFVRLTTLWYLNPVVSYTASTRTVVTKYPHHYLAGDMVGLFIHNASYTVIAEMVVDNFTMVVSAVTGVDRDAVAGEAIVYWMIDKSGEFNYFDQNSDSFVDTFDPLGLTNILPSEDYDPPLDDMVGLVLAHNNIYAGFSKNQLCLSEPDQPHAWPQRYRINFEHTIVAIAVSSGSIIVLTDEYPFVVSGYSPGALSVNRINRFYPCLSKRSVVTLQGVTMWQSRGGIAGYSSSTGAVLLTENLWDETDWDAKYGDAKLVAAVHRDQYLASTGDTDVVADVDSFRFSPGQEGGFWTKLDEPYNGFVLDTRSGNLYALARRYDISIPRGDFTSLSSYGASQIERGVLTTPQQALWKSKRVTFPHYLNLGAARIKAAFTVNKAEAQDAQEAINEREARARRALTRDVGTIGGPDYYYTGTDGGIGSREIAGGALDAGVEPQAYDYTIFSGVYLKLWADGELRFDEFIQTDDIFRLPRGYKADNFEFEIRSNLEVFEVHFAENPNELKDV